MGHAVIGEMEMPVLGREEDAADSFATLTMLKLGTDFSRRVLIESAKGWFLSNQRDEKEGEMLPYYDQHEMDMQRAYQIVCFMVGSDPEKFKELAEATKLPEERRTTCKTDYGNTAWSWQTMLKPHSRPADQPKQKIEVIYGDGKGKLEVYARLFRDVGFLENMAEHLVDRFTWPRPFVMEMRSCGDSNAHWSGKTRKLEICYELAQDFAELYRDYGKELKPPKGKKQR